ncbi:MAG: pirin family protein [Cytophagales bacterium]|nr:pirin family protein [Cytophagales bacterium]
MSQIDLIIEERATNIGKFLVGRLLPFRQKRMVGPFIYIDHMGPVTLGESENFDVLPHPHIGLSTLTYLLEGSILHQDSLGNSIEIHPGAVNWMTAGKGIVHSERTPESLRNSQKSMHGLQIWVALPAHLEQMEPRFSHIESENIPTWSLDGVNYKLIAGEVLGHQSPVPVYSKSYMLEIKSTKKNSISLGSHLFGEIGLYILEGSMEIDGSSHGPKQLLVSNESTLCELTLTENTTLYVFGGEPFPEERFIDWNFVSSNRDLIEEAKQKWINRTFGTIKGDEIEFVPYPIIKK